MKQIRSIIPLALACSSLLGCNEPVEKNAHATPAPVESPSAREPGIAPANVKVAIVQPVSVEEEVVLHGTTLPDRDVTFSAETPGRVNLLAVDLGDRVKKGQVLARIDYEMLRAQLNQAEASYGLARKTLDRIDPLVEEELVSKQRADEARTNQRAAKAALDMARAQLKKSTVRSTLSGIVARRMVDRGEYVVPGQPLLQVVDFSTIVVSAQVPEISVGMIERGMPVKVRVDALDRELEGTVQVVIPASHPESRTFELRVKVANPNHEILVGMATMLHITSRVHRDVILVSQDVVLESDKGRSVFVTEDGVAKKRGVVVGSTHEDKVIIEQGVKAGEAIVVEGQRDLQDGQSIRIVSDPKTQPEKSAGAPVPAA